ncbi:MAG: flagellar biosynthetic protein FliO [Rubrivivax sp.]
MTPGLGSLFWFAAVVAAIPIVLWLLKRTPAGGAAAGGMRTVAVLPLSTSQRIVTVEVGAGDSRCWLVLGVTPGSISTLHTMLPQEEAAPPLPAPSTAFAQLLSRLRRDGDAR